MIEEFDIHLSPIILGKGKRLFKEDTKNNISFELTNAIHSPMVAHLYYKVNKSK